MRVDLVVERWQLSPGAHTGSAEFQRRMLCLLESGPLHSGATFTVIVDGLPDEVEDALRDASRNTGSHCCFCVMPWGIPH